MRKRNFILRSGLSTCCHQAVNYINTFGQIIIRSEDIVPEDLLIEKKLHESENNYRSDFDSISDASLAREISDRITPVDKRCSGCGVKLDGKFSNKYPLQFHDWTGILVGSKFRPVIRMASMESNYFQYKNERIIRKEVRTFFTYNFKSGQLYNVVLGGRLKKKVVRSMISNAEMMTMQFRDHWKRFVELCIKHRAIHLFPEVDLLNILGSICGSEDIQDIALYFEDELPKLFRILHQPNYAKIALLGDLGAIPKRMYKKLDTVDTPSAALDVVLNNPGKVFKRYLLPKLTEKPKATLSAMYYLLNTINRDKLQTLFNARNIWNDDRIHFTTYMGMDGKSMARVFSPGGQKFLRNLKKFVKAYGESRFINQLAENNMSPRYGRPDPFQHLTDAVDLYATILEKAADYELPRQASFKAVHDRLAVDNNKLRDPKEDIIYTEEEAVLNQEINGIVFHAASDTYELFDVGAAMNICVGGYGSGAVAKQFCIVVGYIDKAPFVCLQLRKNKDKDEQENKYDWFVVQAKLHNNELARSNPDISMAVRLWMQKVNAAAMTGDLTMSPEESVHHNNTLFGRPHPAVNVLEQMIENNNFHDDAEDFWGPAAPVVAANPEGPFNPVIDEDNADLLLARGI